MFCGTCKQIEKTKQKNRAMPLCRAPAMLNIDYYYKNKTCSKHIRGTSMTTVTLNHFEGRQRRCSIGNMCSRDAGKSRCSSRNSKVALVVE